MIRRLRWWLFLCVVTGLILAGVGIALWLALRAYGPELSRERLETALTGALGRPVRIERVILRPWLGRAAAVNVTVASDARADREPFLRLGPRMDTERVLSRAFLEAHPAEAGLIVEGLPPEESAALLEEVPSHLATAVLQRMTILGGSECLARVSPERAGPILTALPLDTAASLLRCLDPQAREEVLVSLPGNVGSSLRLLLGYPEDSAGALMDPRILAVPRDLAVGEALARVRKVPRFALYYLYVVDRSQALVGVLNLRELMLAPSKASVASVMHPRVARLNARAGRAAILAHPGWRQFHALPVVDDAGAFLGVIRYETLRHLEDDAAGTQPVHQALATILTLGELCWVGLAGVLGELAATMAPRTAGAAATKEADHGR